MDLDLPHTIVTVLLVLAALTGIRRTSLYRDGSPFKRSLTVGVAVFVVLLILNLIWPYGGTPVFAAG